MVAWNIHSEQLKTLKQVSEEIELPFTCIEREQLCAEADVIMTITCAHEPLLMNEWIRPSTHIACMGTDTKGEQEVDPALVANATLFTDEIAQLISIGEAQHAIRRYRC